MPNRWTVIAAMLVAATLAAPAWADGNAANGEKVFKKCASCHKVGEGAKNLIGPLLNGVVGRTAGTAKDYNYSPLNKNSGENGLVWSEDTIFTYLADPTAFLINYLKSKGKADLATGTTKMTFKLPKEDDRRDVIAYLKQFPATP